MEFFVQICDPVRRESEMRKTCKTKKIKQDYNTPIASWSSALHLQHFVAICFFRNGMAELFAGSTEPKVEQSFPCNQAMLNITVTGTIYGCDELPCLS